MAQSYDQFKCTFALENQFLPLDETIVISDNESDSDVNESLVSVNRSFGSVDGGKKEKIEKKITFHEDKKFGVTFLEEKVTKIEWEAEERQNECIKYDHIQLDDGKCGLKCDRCDHIKTNSNLDDGNLDDGNRKNGEDDSNAEDGANKNETLTSAPGPIDESILALPDDVLRMKLLTVGESPGPILPSTRSLYQRRYQRYKDNMRNGDSPFSTPVRTTAATPTSHLLTLPVVSSPNVTIRCMNGSKTGWKNADENGLQVVQAGPATDETPIVPTTPKYAPSQNPFAPSQTPRTPKNAPDSLYSLELSKLLNPIPAFPFLDAKKWEKEFLEHFSHFSSSKKYFNYILLDPRVMRRTSASQGFGDTNDSNGLNAHAQSDVYPSASKMYDRRQFKQFLGAIFYIGKGVGDRPYMHLYEAVLYERSQARKQASVNPSADQTKKKITICDLKVSKESCEKKNAKVERIIDIWNSNQGVVTLNCFNSITSEEALARECLLIDTIKMENLTNKVSGHKKKGIDLRWTEFKKRILGAYFLFKAFQIYNIEGEKQIKRADIRR